MKKGHTIRRKRTAASDEQTADAIVDQVRPRLFNLFMYLTSEQEVAEDLTQEALVRFWESLPNFRGECSMLTWAVRIAHHTLNDYRRRQYREQKLWSDPIEMVGEAAPPEETLEQVTLRCAVAQAMQQLPDVAHQAVVLVKVEGFSYREASAILGEPEGTVKWRVMEALHTLKELLKESEEFREGEEGHDVRLHET